MPRSVAAIRNLKPPVFYLTAGLETGHLCPITMTSASLAALSPAQALFRQTGTIWRRPLCKYDQEQKPPVEKPGLTLGMGMTEKQGGTDVPPVARSSGPAAAHRLTGHK